MAHTSSNFLSFLLSSQRRSQPRRQGEAKEVRGATSDVAIAERRLVEIRDGSRRDGGRSNVVIAELRPVEIRDYKPQDGGNPGKRNLTLSRSAIEECAII